MSTCAFCPRRAASGGLQSEVEDLIWEVDEDCDQTVSWKEFQTMYQRCNTDTAGASFADSTSVGQAHDISELVCM